MVGSCYAVSMLDWVHTMYDGDIGTRYHSELTDDIIFENSGLLTGYHIILLPPVYFSQRQL